MEPGVRAVKRCRHVKIRRPPEAAPPLVHGSCEVDVRGQGSQGSASRGPCSCHCTLYGMCAPRYGRMTDVIAGRLCLPVSLSVMRIPIS